MNRKIVNCEEDRMSMLRSQNDLLKVTESPEGKIIDFYLTNEICDIEDYIDFLREAGTAKTQDVIKVHINCYGGDMSVGYNIYDALKESQAEVEIYIEGNCMSAASVIMLAGNCWYVYPHSCVMIHCWSGWNYGKWNELQSAHDFDKRIREKQFRAIYKNFLTEDEIDKLIDGTDYWFDYEETMNRLQNYQAEAVAKQKAVEAVAAKYQDIMNKEIQDIINNPEVKEINKAPKSKAKKAKK